MIQLLLASKNCSYPSCIRTLCYRFLGYLNLKPLIPFPLPFQSLSFLSFPILANTAENTEILFLAKLPIRTAAERAKRIINSH